MKYEELTNTLNEIISNEKIYKNGLSLVYELPDKLHKKLNEELYYSTNKKTLDTIKPLNEFEIDYEGIIIKFIKKKN